MQFDVNLNATLVVDDETFEQTVDCYRFYDGQDEYDLKESGEYRYLKDAREALAADYHQAREQAIEELANDLEGSQLDSIYGRAWVCSVDEPTEM